MKLILSSVAILLSTGIANASLIDIPPMNDVPEISAIAGFAAIGVVGAVMALVWERRRK